MNSVPDRVGVFDYGYHGRQHRARNLSFKLRLNARAWCEIQSWSSTFIGIDLLCCQYGALRHTSDEDQRCLLEAVLLRLRCLWSGICPIRCRIFPTSAAYPRKWECCPMSRQQQACLRLALSLRLLSRFRVRRMSPGPRCPVVLSGAGVRTVSIRGVRLPLAPVSLVPALPVEAPPAIYFLFSLIRRASDRRRAWVLCDEIQENGRKCRRCYDKKLRQSGPRLALTPNRRSRFLLSR